MIYILHRSCWVGPGISTLRTSPRMEVPLDSYKIPFLTFNVSNWNFLNGGGNDVEVEMRSLITVISFSVVQERSTACNGKKRKFRCSNDLIRRIDKVTSDWDCVVILQHFDRKTTAAERIGLRWYVVIFSCLVSIWRDYSIIFKTSYNKKNQIFQFYIHWVCKGEWQ